MDIKESRRIIGADSKGKCVNEGSPQVDVEVCSVGFCNSANSQKDVECVLVSDFDYEDIDTLTKSKKEFYWYLFNHIHRLFLFDKANYGTYLANG